MNAAERLNATFLALADPTRRAILARLASGMADGAEMSYQKLDGLLAAA